MKRVLLVIAALLSLTVLLAACKKSGDTISTPTAESTPATVEATPAPTELPPYEANVLTGEPKGADYPEGQRITAVMVNNIVAARPQRGLSKADILFEIKVEGGRERTVGDSVYGDVQRFGFRGVRGDRFLTYPNRAGSLETCGFKQRFWSLLGLRPKVTRARGRGTLPVGDMEEKRTGRRGRRPLQRVRRKCAGIWRCVDAGCRGRRPLRERERGRQQI